MIFRSGLVGSASPGDPVLREDVDDDVHPRSIAALWLYD